MQTSRYAYGKKSGGVGRYGEGGRGKCGAKNNRLGMTDIPGDRGGDMRQ